MAIIGIDASRSRSGGARAHLLGVLNGADPREFGISKVHVWAYESLYTEISEKEWLVRHCPAALRGSILSQLRWQFFSLPRLARSSGCNLLFNTDAGSICPFKPCVTLSQDMLSFEPGEIDRFGLTKARLRLEILKKVQAQSLKRASIAMFLTRHAEKTIRQVVRNIGESRVVNHGIGDEFRSNLDARTPENRDIFEFLYVSNAALYKHQWVTVEATARLRHKLNKDIRLKLVGGGTGKAQALLARAIQHFDADQEFVSQLNFVPNSQIPIHLNKADAFVYASSCENMPVTLLEAMAFGLPIACSNRGPMPEILEDAGIYFDPESVESCVLAMESIFINESTRNKCGKKASKLSKNYSWERCSRETWECLADAVQREEGT